ncbi:MAG: single-stranded DNA-binding protein [Waterburya sp.]
MTFAIITQSGILEQPYKTGDRQLATLKIDEVSILLSFYKVEESTLTALLGKKVLVAGKLFAKNNSLEIDCDTIVSFTGDASVVTFVGRSGREINARIFESGKSVAKGSVAVNQYGREDTSWFNFEAWNKKSEVLANYVKKGSLFGGYGSIKVDKYKNKEDKDVMSPLISLKEVYLLAKSVSQPVSVDDSIESQGVSF